jgi:PAS domain S-box-containing protein
MKFLDLLRQPGLRLLDSITYPIAAQDESGRLVYVNPAFTREFGIPAERAIGRIVAAQLDPTERSIYVDAMRQWREGVARPARVTVRARDGRIHPYLILPQPLPDASGQHAGTILVFVDPEPLADILGERIQSAGRLVRSLLRTISEELDQALDRSDVMNLDLEDLRRRVPALKTLTEREWAVANRIGRGDRTSLVAEDLGISANTVRNHLKSIFRKTGARSQVELVASFKRWRERPPASRPEREG